MHLSPREIEKLMLHNAGAVAQKRLARGLKLNHPEAVALGRQLLGRRQVMAGVAEMLGEVQVEGTFPDGTKLVTVHTPIAADDGDLELALYASGLAVPDRSAFDEAADQPTGTPGECLAGDETLELNAGRETATIEVTNLGDRPVQVGSHYHFIETNRQLRFDRGAAYGRRLDIPAGTAVRFEPGETRTVTLVDIAGERVIHGGNNVADGPVSDAGRITALDRVAAEGFAHQE